uniref:Uncharacterized protein n=1 Tax=Pyricularia oryzae (strain P131) TaxID=1143193 RepID=L7IUA1_PYRO1
MSSVRAESVIGVPRGVGLSGRRVWPKRRILSTRRFFNAGVVDGGKRPAQPPPEMLPVSASSRASPVRLRTRLQGAGGGEVGTGRSRGGVLLTTGDGGMACFLRRRSWRWPIQGPFGTVFRFDRLVGDP